MQPQEPLFWWCQQILQPYVQLGLLDPVADFATSWQNGVAFLALVHTFRPDVVPELETIIQRIPQQQQREQNGVNNSLLFSPISNDHTGLPPLPGRDRSTSLSQQQRDFLTILENACLHKQSEPRDWYQILYRAFHLATSALHIPLLIDPEDILMGEVLDERNIIVYIAEFYWMSVTNGVDVSSGSAAVAAAAAAASVASAFDPSSPSPIPAAIMNTNNNPNQDASGNEFVEMAFQQPQPQQPVAPIPPPRNDKATISAMATTQQQPIANPEPVAPSSIVATAAHEPSPPRPPAANDINALLSHYMNVSQQLADWIQKNQQSQFQLLWTLYSGTGVTDDGAAPSSAAASPSLSSNNPFGIPKATIQDISYNGHMNKIFQLLASSSGSVKSLGSVVHEEIRMLEDDMRKVMSGNLDSIPPPNLFEGETNTSRRGVYLIQQFESTYYQLEDLFSSSSSSSSSSDSAFDLTMEPIRRTHSKIRQDLVYYIDMSIPDASSVLNKYVSWCNGYEVAIQSLEDEIGLPDLNGSGARAQLRNSIRAQVDNWGAKVDQVSEQTRHLIMELTNKMDSKRKQEELYDMEKDVVTAQRRREFVHDFLQERLEDIATLAEEWKRPVTPVANPSSPMATSEEQVKQLTSSLKEISNSIESSYLSQLSSLMPKLNEYVAFLKNDIMNSQAREDKDSAFAMLAPKSAPTSSSSPLVDVNNSNATSTSLSVPTNSRFAFLPTFLSLRAQALLDFASKELSPRIQNQYTTRLEQCRSAIQQTLQNMEQEKKKFRRQTLIMTDLEYDTGFYEDAVPLLNAYVEKTRQLSSWVTEQSDAFQTEQKRYQEMLADLTVKYDGLNYISLSRKIEFSSKSYQRSLALCRKALSDAQEIRSLTVPDIDATWQQVVRQGLRTPHVPEFDASLPHRVIEGKVLAFVKQVEDLQTNYFPSFAHHLAKLLKLWVKNRFSRWSNCEKEFFEELTVLKSSLSSKTLVLNDFETGLDSDDQIANPALSALKHDDLKERLKATVYDWWGVLLHQDQSELEDQNKLDLTEAIAMEERYISDLKKFVEEIKKRAIQVKSNPFTQKEFLAEVHTMYQELDIFSVDLLEFWSRYDLLRDDYLKRVQDRRGEAQQGLEAINASYTNSLSTLTSEETVLNELSSMTGNLVSSYEKSLEWLKSVEKMEKSYHELRGLCSDVVLDVQKVVVDFETDVKSGKTSETSQQPSTTESDGDKKSAKKVDVAYVLQRIRHVENEIASAKTRFRELPSQTFSGLVNMGNLAKKRETIFAQYQSTVLDAFVKLSMDVNGLYTVLDLIYKVKEFKMDIGEVFAKLIEAQSSVDLIKLPSVDDESVVDEDLSRTELEIEKLESFGRSCQDALRSKKLSHFGRKTASPVTERSPVQEQTRALRNQLMGLVEFELDKVSNGTLEMTRIIQRKKRSLEVFRSVHSEVVKPLLSCDQKLERVREEIDVIDSVPQQESSSTDENLKKISEKAKLIHGSLGMLRKVISHLKEVMYDLLANDETVLAQVGARLHRSEVKLKQVCQYLTSRIKSFSLKELCKLSPTLEMLKRKLESVGQTLEECFFNEDTDIANLDANVAKVTGVYGELQEQVSSVSTILNSTSVIYNDLTALLRIISSSPSAASSSSSSSRSNPSDSSASPTLSSVDQAGGFASESDSSLDMDEFTLYSARIRILEATCQELNERVSVNLVYLDFVKPATEKLIKMQEGVDRAEKVVTEAKVEELENFLSEVSKMIRVKLESVSSRDAPSNDLQSLQERVRDELNGMISRIEKCQETLAFRKRSRKLVDEFIAQTFDIENWIAARLQSTELMSCDLEMRSKNYISYMLSALRNVNGRVPAKDARFEARNSDFKKFLAEISSTVVTTQGSLKRYFAYDYVQNNVVEKLLQSRLVAEDEELLYRKQAELKDRWDYLNHYVQVCHGRVVFFTRLSEWCEKITVQLEPAVKELTARIGQIDESVFSTSKDVWSGLNLALDKSLQECALQISSCVEQKSMVEAHKASLMESAPFEDEEQKLMLDKIARIVLHRFDYALSRLVEKHQKAKVTAEEFAMAISTYQSHFGSLSGMMDKWLATLNSVLESKKEALLNGESENDRVVLNDLISLSITTQSQVDSEMSRAVETYQQDADKLASAIQIGIDRSPNLSKKVMAVLTKNRDHITSSFKQVCEIAHSYGNFVDAMCSIHESDNLLSKYLAAIEEIKAPLKDSSNPDIAPGDIAVGAGKIESVRKVVEKVDTRTISSLPTVLKRVLDLNVSKFTERKSQSLLNITSLLKDLSKLESDLRIRSTSPTELIALKFSDSNNWSDSQIHQVDEHMTSLLNVLQRLSEVIQNKSGKRFGDVQKSEVVKLISDASKYCKKTHPELAQYKKRVEDIVSQLDTRALEQDAARMVVQQARDKLAMVESNLGRYLRMSENLSYLLEQMVSLDVAETKVEELVVRISKVSKTDNDGIKTEIDGLRHTLKRHESSNNSVGVNVLSGSAQDVSEDFKIRFSQLVDKIGLRIHDLMDILDGLTVSLSVTFETQQPLDITDQVEADEDLNATVDALLRQSNGTESPTDFYDYYKDIGENGVNAKTDLEFVYSGDDDEEEEMKRKTNPAMRRLALPALVSRQSPSLATSISSPASSDITPIPTRTSSKMARPDFTDLSHIMDALKFTNPR